MSIETWGLMDKSLTDAEKVEAAISRLITAHNADETAHLGVGQSLQSHKASEIIDHLIGSVLADKLQNSGLVLTCVFDDLSAFVQYGDIQKNGWPGVTMVPTYGTPLKAYLSSIGGNLRKYINYSLDFLIQFSFFLSEEGPASGYFWFGQVPESGLVKGIGLELTPASDKVHWIKTGGDVYSSNLNISRAAWHTFRMQYSSYDKQIKVYLDGFLVFTLDEPASEVLSGGSDFQVRCVDGGSGESMMMVEYVTFAII